MRVCVHQRACAVHTARYSQDARLVKICSSPIAQLATTWPPPRGLPLTFSLYILDRGTRAPKTGLQTASQGRTTRTRLDTRAVREHAHIVRALCQANTPYWPHISERILGNFSSEIMSEKTCSLFLLARFFTTQSVFNSLANITFCRDRRVYT